MIHIHGLTTNPILATKKPRSQRSRRHRSIQPRRARTCQLSSHAQNKILDQQKGRLKFRRPLFLIRFLLKILQQPPPFRVRHIRIAAQLRIGFPSLRGCQRGFRNIRDSLLRQPILLAQGFEIIGRIAQFKIFDHISSRVGVISSSITRCNASNLGCCKARKSANKSISSSSCPLLMACLI